MEGDAPDAIRIVGSLTDALCYGTMGIAMITKIKSFLSGKPVMSQEEMISVIKSWTTNFEIRTIRQIASIPEMKRKSQEMFLCRIEGTQVMGRTGLHKYEILAVAEALHVVHDWIETEVTQILGEELT